MICHLKINLHFSLIAEFYQTDMTSFSNSGTANEWTGGKANRSGSELWIRELEERQRDQIRLIPSQFSDDIENLCGADSPGLLCEGSITLMPKSRERYCKKTTDQYLSQI